MIHQINPHKYYPEYRNQQPKETDFLLIFEDNRILLLSDKNEHPYIPNFLQVEQYLKNTPSLLYLFQNAEYLFSIDESAFYRINIKEYNQKTDTMEPLLQLPDSNYLYSMQTFRSFQPEYLAFAGVTACQINRFRMERQFCGKCGAKTTYSKTERAMICTKCGLTEYPKISPAVITAITNGDKLLLTKYAGCHSQDWALVAGFVEVGETFKAAVRREAMEEVGLKLKNITYYKSQPWSFSDSDMIGFFAELDGDDTITLQEDELSTAQWIKREELPDVSSSLSIGAEMITLFKNGHNPV